jgi:integrase
LDRLEDKMAIHQSRGKAKDAARESGERLWAFSTGRIHSFKTRSTYQEHILKFVTWARATHHVKSLERDLDPRADELATEWLQQRLAESKSPYTLQVQRAALRLFFDNRQLAATVPIPRRARENITRSRGEKAHDRHFQPANWPELVKFLEATGLRRQELRDLHVRDIWDQGSQVVVHVVSGKGGRWRDVPVLPRREGDVLAVKEGRDPGELAFARIPKHLDVHSYRRAYAQALYLYHAPGWCLPPATGRLKPRDYDRAAAKCVTEALGHNRIDVVLRHYVR